MKTVFYIYILLGISLSSFAQTFEGKITFSTADLTSKETAQVDYYTNGSYGKMLFQTNNEFGSNQYEIYTESNGSKTYLATPSTSTYIDVSNHINGFDLYQNTIFAAKTGQTQSILGYTCEEVKLTTDQNQITIWVSTQLPFTKTDLSSPLAQSGIFEILNQWQIAGIPVKTEIKDKKGNLTSSQEITNIVIQAQNVSDLQLPIHYTAAD
ncbi:MAG: DUF4412 domain-containing protein [Aureispira sp.]|nr:DUF4412 domain-containing protein [Aureispira sp.]